MNVAKLTKCAAACCAVAAAGAAFAADGASGQCELRIGSPTGAAIKPMHGVGAGPKTGWGLGRDGGIYIDATELYRQVAPPFVRLHDIETPFAREQFFDVHVYMKDQTLGHAQYFAKSDEYVDSILAASPNAKIIFRIGESIGVADRFNPYAVKPADTAAWCAAAVDIAKHYVEKYPKVEWYFEIWNEANLTGHNCHKTFASAPNAGDTCPSADYFALYEAAATALGSLREKGGYRNMKIGGPAASGIDKGPWSTFSCDEFLAFLESRSAARGSTIPMDFYSWHRYDGPELMRMDANRVHKSLQRTTRYRNALNVCDEWNLTVDDKRIPLMTAPEGAANALATMIAFQESALDAATYYDAQLSGGFNGLWYKPYLDAFTVSQDVQLQLLAEFHKKGVAGITEATRNLLSKHADLPLVVLCGHWAMRSFTKLASLGQVLEIKRGDDVPKTLYALAACRGQSAAMAVANNSDKPVSLRIVGEKRPGPVSVTCVTGEQRPLAPAKAEVAERASFDGTLAVSLPPFGIALVEFGASQAAVER